MFVIENILLSIIFICGLIVLIGLSMLFWEQFNTPIIPVSKLRMQKSAFVGLVLQWCHHNLRYANTKKPTYEISYYKRKDRCGHYDSDAHKIVIYVNKHADLLQLTNTVIHEYIHARQGKKEIKQSYKYYTKKLGYWNNPFEIEARKVAGDNDAICLKELQLKHKIYGE